MSVLDSMQRLLALAANISSLGEKVDRIEVWTREELKDLRQEIREERLERERVEERYRVENQELRERIQKMENFFEFAEKAGMLRLPGKND